MSCLVPSGVFHCIATCKVSLPLLSLDIQTFAICRCGETLLSPAPWGLEWDPSLWRAHDGGESTMSSLIPHVNPLHSPPESFFSSSCPLDVSCGNSPNFRDCLYIDVSQEIVSRPTGHLTSRSYKSCQIQNSLPPLSSMHGPTLPAPALYIFHLSQ